MAAPAQPPAKGAGKKFPSMQSPTTWLVILGIALAGGAYLLWRQHQAAAAAASTAGTTTTPPDTTDYSGEIATLQAEIADLQSSFAQDTAGTTGGTVSVPKVTGMSVAAADALITAAGLKPGAHSGDTGTVNGQTPGAGAKVAPGSAVDLSVAASGSGGTTGLKAPSAPSVTPYAKSADFGWGAVDGAKAYELEVTGAGGKGTGTSHYDHVMSGTHAEGVGLAKGAYKARVRAGTSAAAVTGPWSPYRQFEVKGAVIGGGKPPRAKVPPEKED